MDKEAEDEGFSKVDLDYLVQSSIDNAEKDSDIDDEVKILIDKAYAQCKQILTENEEKLMAVVDHLMKHETMSGAQFAACMEGRPIDENAPFSLFDTVEE